MNKQLKNFGFGIQSKQAFALGLAAIIGLASVQPSAIAAPPQLKKPQSQAQQPSRPGLQRIRGFKQEFTPEQIRKLSQVKPLDHDDILLVMPNAKAEQDEISDACAQAKGEIVAEFGEGAMKILVIKTEHGKGSSDAAKTSSRWSFQCSRFQQKRSRRLGSTNLQRALN